MAFLAEIDSDLKLVEQDMDFPKQVQSALRCETQYVLDDWDFDIAKQIYASL